MGDFDLVHFSPIDKDVSRLRVPFCREFIHFDQENGVMRFNGRYDPVDEKLPMKVRCYMTLGGKKKQYRLEIISYETLEDTSQDHYDVEEEDGSRICLFPSNIIELKVRPLGKEEKQE